MKDRVFEKLPSAEKLLYVIGKQCRECVCGSRREVAMCVSKNCPLYDYRPYVETQEDKDWDYEQKAKFRGCSVEDVRKQEEGELNG